MPPALVPSNVSNVLQVHSLHQKKQLIVNRARKDGFKQKKAKTHAMHRRVAPSRRVARHRWTSRKVGTVQIAASTVRALSVKNQNHAPKAQRAATIERAAFPVRRAPPVLKDPCRAFHAPKANLLQ